MRPIILIASIFVLAILVKCADPSDRITPFYKERNLSFLSLRHGFDTTNTWIRDSSNIISVHETFKKIGYHNLINDYSWSTPGIWIWYIDNTRSLNTLIDSLIITYPKSEVAPKYYREFWVRRSKESNANAVYDVLREIQGIIHGKQQNPNDDLINDTLYNLLSFEYVDQEISDAKAVDHLDYLIAIGLHQSAFNVLTGERYA